MNKFNNGILFPRKIKRVSVFLFRDDYFPEQFFEIPHEQNRIAAPISRFYFPHASSSCSPTYCRWNPQSFRERAFIYSWRVQPSIL